MKKILDLTNHADKTEILTAIAKAKRSTLEDVETGIFNRHPGYLRAQFIRGSLALARENKTATGPGNRAIVARANELFKQ